MPLNKPVSRFSVSRLFVLCAFLFFQSGVVQAAIPASERAALIALYDSTDGANWTNNTGWLGVVGTECGWYGIICGNEHVTNINFHANNLHGNIPSELGQLSQLEVLYLPYNHLTGPIPVELGQLSQLRWLQLQGNYSGDSQLSGTIPSELGQLSQLQYLDLGQNQLTGNIPAELGQLSQLIELKLDENSFTGSIPTELGQLSQLTSLSIYNNYQLTGTIPVELGQLSQLRDLSIGGSRLLTGGIPAELGQLSQLEGLNLGFNYLGGTIPAELGQLSRLKWINISFNNLTGGIPAELNQLSQLDFLDLRNNQLTGSIPSELGQLTQLQFLRLQSNKLTGSIPADLGQLSLLESLGLDSNLLDFFPLELTQLASLDYLAVSSNCLTETTLDTTVITFLNQKDPNWQTQNPDCSVLPPSSPPPVIISEGITGLNFKVELSEPLSAGQGVFINFDDQQGDWFDQQDEGGHIALQHQGGNIYSTERVLDKPGLRSVRAGIFQLNNPDDILLGAYSAGSSCTEKVCLDAIPRENSYGNPGITGSGSQLFKNVDVANGNYHLSTVAISVPGKGPSFSFSHAYNSLAETPWSFGYEMKASFFDDIDIDDTTVLSTDRRMVIGPREDGSLLYYFKDLDGLWYTFTPGNFNQLIENPDFSFTLYTQGNRLYNFADPESTAAGRLQSIADRLGNTLSFDYNGANRLIQTSTF